MTDKNIAHAASKEARNIKSDPLTSLTWKGADPDSSLEGLFKYVEAKTDKAMAWYWRKKGAKAMLSRTIQFSAVVLTALGALIPVAINLLRGPLKLGDVDNTRALVMLLLHVARPTGNLSGLCRHVR